MITKNRTTLLVFVMLLIGLCACASATSTDLDRSISFAENDYVLYVGKTLKIEAIIENLLDTAPKKTQLVWSSSNQDVASVNASGVITGKNAGKVDIEVSAKDNEAIKASVEVEVRVPVRTVQINENNVAVVIGGPEEASKARLTYTLQPENAFHQSGTWTSSDENVAVVDSEGVVTGISAGSAKITFTSDDPSSQKKAQTTVKVGQAVTEIILPEKEVVNVKKSITLKPEIKPANSTNKKLEYVSSDPSIATVSSSGQITGVANGEAVITCTTTDGSNVSASVSVSVFQPVQSMKLDKNKLNAFAGKTSEPLVVTIAPADAKYQTFTWSSSDESVAKVDENGAVTGIAGGKAQITATSTEPVSGNAKPKSVTCQVTVSQAVEYIGLEKNEAKSSNKNLVLNVTVLPETATNKKVKWTSSDSKVATVNGGRVKIKRHEGETIITATAEDGSGIYGSCRVTVGFSGTVIQIGSYVRRYGSYVWDVDSFNGNGSLDGLKESINTSDDIDREDLSEAEKGEMSEAQLLLTTTREEILFRDIPWGSNLYAVRPKISFDSFWKPEVVDGGSYKKLIKHSFDDKIRVAGHTVNSLECLFTYDVDEEGKVGKTSLFYYAEYGLNDDNQKTRSEDIETKLIEKYGEPDKTEDVNSNKTMLWYGQNYTKLKYVLHGGKITISYEWVEGAKKRTEADEAYAKNQSEVVEEKPSYSDSKEGL